MTDSGASAGFCILSSRHRPGGTEAGLPSLGLWSHRLFTNLLPTPPPPHWFSYSSQLNRKGGPEQGI